MAFYSYLSTKIIIAFITKSYKDLFGVRSYINAIFKRFSSSFNRVSASEYRKLCTFLFSNISTNSPLATKIVFIIS